MEEDSKNVRSWGYGTKSLELVHRDFDDRFSMGAHFFVTAILLKKKLFLSNIVPRQFVTILT